jgi:hypothetical protein
MNNLKLTPEQTANAKILSEKKLSLVELNMGHSDVIVLHVNDKPVQCPFRNPYPIPHAITGRVDFNVPLCSNDCQFFNLVGLEDQTTGEKIETVFFDCVGCSKTLTP